MDSASRTRDPSATVDDDTETPPETPGRSTVSTFFAETPPDVEAWLQQRRDRGLDGRDEIWEGVLHVTPFEHARNVAAATALTALTYARARAAGLVPCGPFNLGGPGNYRIPDAGFFRGATSLYLETAAVAVEVLSPHDETFAKFGFYAAHGVEELWVLDPLDRSVRMWQLGAAEPGLYEETGRSGLLGLSAAAVQEQLDWPEG